LRVPRLWDLCPPHGCQVLPVADGHLVLTLSLVVACIPRTATVLSQSSYILLVKTPDCNGILWHSRRMHCFSSSQCMYVAVEYEAPTAC
jgi:hypothetical protein